MPGVLVLDNEKNPIILKKCHYLKVNPGYLTGFPVGNLEGFLVGQKEEKKPAIIAIIAMITRVNKILQGT